MRLRRVYDEDTNWSLQMYYDNTMRKNALLTEIDNTLDVEFQYRFPLGKRHSITCGTGFRNVVSYIPGGDTFTTFFPTPYWTTNYTNQFVQDVITLVEDRWALTAGCKLEQNPYTGLEYQPNFRLLWTPDRRRAFWGAISRAVRTPSRAEEQMTVTFFPVAPNTYPRITGNSDIQSEAEISYEIGYREQTTDRFSWDIAMFYSVYDRLLAVKAETPFSEPVPPPPHVILPAMFANGAGGVTNGVELAVNYAVSQRWRLYTQYTYFHMYIQNGLPVLYTHQDPCNQVYLRSEWELRKDLEFDLIARYVDSLVGNDVPSYITMDLRLAYRPRKHLELAIVGQNLLQAHHWEFVSVHEVKN